jgi:hypothetical protein
MRYTIFIVILVLLWIGGCTPVVMDTPPIPPTEKTFKISSLADYNSSLCTSIGYGNNPGGFSSGIRLVLKDKTTGELLEGDGDYSTNAGGGSLGPGEYSCEEGIDSKYAAIFAHSKGYAPSVFILTYPTNKLATVEVSMVKSCTGGPSFFDNLIMSAFIMDNQTLAGEYQKDGQDRFYDIIKNEIGLEKTDYTLDCMEGDMGRGGYIKARGKLNDSSSFELYYHWGWCSSGGSDCGWSKCFSSESNRLMASVKNITCGQISSRVIHNDYTCASEAYDRTDEVKNKCNAGEFEKVDGSKRIISIIQNSGRCEDSVNVGDLSCLGD